MSTKSATSVNLASTKTNMANVQVTNCDGCGATVFGHVDSKKVQKEYLSIKGAKVSLQFVDDYFFITPAPAGDLAFCLKEGMPCLQQFIDRKRAFHAHHRRQQLSEQAERESGGSTFVVGRKG